MPKHGLKVVQAVRQTNIQYSVIHEGFQWENVVDVPIFILDLAPILVAFNARLQVGKLVAQNLLGSTNLCLLKQLKSPLDHASALLTKAIIQLLGFPIFNPPRMIFLLPIFIEPI